MTKVITINELRSRWYEFENYDAVLLENPKRCLAAIHETKEPYFTTVNFNWRELGIEANKERFDLGLFGGTKVKLVKTPQRHIDG